MPARLFAGAAAVLLVVLGAIAAHAQRARLPMVGVLTPAAQQWRETAFRERLRELGYVDGVSVVLAIRSADAHLDRMPSLARELIRLRPDVIVGINAPGTRAALGETRTIPILSASGS